MKFSIKDFFSKCAQIRRKLRICSHLLKKSLMKIFIFCAVSDPAVAAIDNRTNATFKITDTKLYVPVVTLSIENDKRLSGQLKTGFNRTIKWNKYRSEMTNQTQNNNLNYLIDPTFTEFNRLFVLLFENENNSLSFSKYFLPDVQIKVFKVLIDRKKFFYMPIKNGDKTYEHIIEMGRNKDYTTYLQFI